jgi:hypothetical protein
LGERVDAPGKRRPLAGGAPGVNVADGSAAETWRRIRRSWHNDQPATDERYSMRAVLLILILVVAAVLVAVATGFLDINQIRGAKAPQVSATRNGVTAKGGQTPAFDIETGSVAVGTRKATVTVPSVEVQRPGNEVAPAAAPANTVNAM